MRKKYHQWHYAKDKQKYVDRAAASKRVQRKLYREWKKTLCCSFCPEDESVTIDLHHLDKDEKDFSISQIAGRGWSWERLLKEIEKCVPLCANCHRKVHKYGFEETKARVV